VQTRNNVRETLITVRQGGLRVAYFDIFRTEVKSIRQLNASDQMQIDFQLVRSGAARGAGVIDARWFEPGRYDVFIIGDVAAEQFTPEALTQLGQRVREGAGLMMLGGYQTYSAGGYAGSPLQEFLPIQLNRGEQLAAGQIDPRQQIQAELKLQPTAAGNRHFVTRIDSVAENQAAWQELPPLSGATRIRAKSDFVEVLATSGTGDHLIVAAETGRSRVMCLAFDQTYLWSQAGFDEAHRRFWRQAVLWLAHKELETDQPIWLTVLPKAIDPGGRVTLEYGARDDEGNPLAGVQFQTQVKTPDGKAVPVNGTPTELGAAAGFTETVLPGDYFVSVDARLNGNSVGLPAQARFLVHDRDLELDYPIVDRGMLSDIAQQAGMSTDSRLINPENLEEFLADYLKRKPWKSQLEVTMSLNLWDGWPILLIFSLLMTIEWVIRKQGGLV
jgi:uncharacterized membrane protein